MSSGFRAQARLTPVIELQTKFFHVRHSFDPGHFAWQASFCTIGIQHTCDLMTADTRFQQVAQELGHDFSGEIKIGGHYVPVLQAGHQLFVSGQIPRVGDEVSCRFLDSRGVHTRTSVGVLQLPKGAAVELDLIATAIPIEHRV